MISEISETEKDRYCINSLMCGKKAELVETETKITITRDWGVEKGVDIGQKSTNF